MKKALFTLLAVFAVAGSVSAVASYFNGFEVDTDGWNNFGGGTITRVASGTNGVASATGSYHAEAEEGVFTRWGGYETAFPADGYVTKVDIYLDMSLADGSDKRFDFSSAINNEVGSHRRDFVFSAGTLPGAGATNQWAVSASNNTPGWPNNPGRSPILLSQTGWYTFEHTFQNDGTGVLEVVMKVKDANGTVMGTWTLSDPTDVIGTTVGGNRYGWLVTNQFGTLAVDNSEKFNVVPLVSPTAKDDCKKDGWKNFNNPFFKNQGDCVSYLESSQNAVGN